MPNVDPKAASLWDLLKHVPVWVPVLTVICTGMVTGGATWGVSQYRLNEYDKKIESIQKDFHETTTKFTESQDRLTRSLQQLNDVVIRLDERMKNFTEKR